MAYSESIRKSQIAINCQLCKTGEKIKSKCLDCDLLLCNKCKEKVHSKFKNAKDHRIVDIKDVGKHLEEELDFKNINCKEHSKQYCYLFCQTCDGVVCPSCVSKVHKKHDLIEISEAYDKKLEKMKTKQSRFQEELAEINQEKIRLNQLKTDESSKYNKVDQEILDHGKAIKLAVDVYVDKIHKELQESKNAVIESINSDLDTIENISQQYEGHSSKTEDLINTKDVSKFFEQVKVIENVINKSLKPQIKSTYNSIQKFVPGEITQSNVGVLEKDSKQTEIQLSFVKEFQTELPLAVTLLCVCADDSLWICHPSSTLQKVKPQGNSLQILSSHNIKVYGMALTPNNDLLLATGETHLKQITNNSGTIQDSIYNIDPYRPTSVHVSKDYKVMVGGFRQSRRVVIVMNQTGEQLTVYQQDKQNQTLFTCPWRITSTSNNWIYIADYRSIDDHGRLLMIDRTGDEQYYIGHHEVNKTKAFKPVGLTTTPNDNVIVADVKTYTLHIFNNTGQLITFYKTADIGIQHPYSVGVTSSGQLYIGCTSISANKEKAKLYQVNISGCL